ncbi:MAG TPA: diadenylate cyclase CdaA [Rectinemataceae bacterium]|nr:diadenylate cyclase CdaA [Rectinemataceae bacterium]
MTGILGAGQPLDWIRTALDILLLAFLLYRAWGLLVSAQAVHLLRGAVVLVALWGVAFFLQLTTVSWVLTTLAPALVIALAIVFQPELRKLVLKLGQGRIFGGAQGPDADTIDAVMNAAGMLAATRRGALIVFARTVGMRNFAETGNRLDAVVSSSLIVSVFGWDTPLHDGAIIVQEGRAVAAGCFLPLSEQQDIRKSFGTRHRAALGLSEVSDAVVLVVSEETGAISIAENSRLFYDLGVAQARRMLGDLLSVPGEESEDDDE